LKDRKQKERKTERKKIRLGPRSPRKKERKKEENNQQEIATVRYSLLGPK